MTTGKTKILHFFSPDERALRRELRNHPTLLEKINKEYLKDDVGGIIGEIAAHVNVVMDGTYTNEELERLYPILVEKLIQKRSIRLH